MVTEVTLGGMGEGESGERTDRLESSDPALPPKDGGRTGHPEST